MQEVERPVCAAAAGGSEEGGSESMDVRPSSTRCAQPSPTSSAGGNEYVCDEYWYGKPRNEDCVVALSNLPDHGLAEHRRRLFIPIGNDDLHQVYTTSRYTPVRTPLIFTHGA